MKKKKLSPEYHQYLRSEHWKHRRQAVFHNQGVLCKLCWQAPATDVHHVTYGNRLASAQKQSLRPVCRKCHDLIHSLIDTGKLVYASKNGKKRWRQTLYTVKSYAVDVFRVLSDNPFSVHATEHQRHS